MRTFVALEVSDFAPDLKKLKVGLKKAKNLEHQWIPREHWHIPLCNLQGLGRDKLLEIERLLHSISGEHAPFDLRLEGVWAWPSQDHGRLLWIGVQNSKYLRNLQSHLAQNLSEYMEEGEFKPYLPIVRLRNHREVSDVLSPWKNADFGKVQMNTLALFEMTSGGAFPTYRKLMSYALEERESSGSLMMNDVP